MDGYTILLAAVLAGAAIAYLTARKNNEKKMIAIYQQLLQRLDRALSGEIQETAYDESLDAAVAERLNRMVRISGMHQGQAERERDIVKSMISDISHQVRTPLANIMLYTGLLQECPLDPESTLLAGKIQKQSEKLSFFMKELARSAYAEQEIISIHPEMTNLEEILHSACQLVEMEALKKKITIVLEETHARCYADKKWTTEAIGNVLDNAIKYSPNNSQITVTVPLYESFACIQVQDQGIGIQEEEQGKVFERFYRSASVQNEPGFGIGLYLVREVLAKQGGYAKIASRAGEGSTVFLYLPRYAQH